MGTRGAYGFRIGSKDKILYNHWDSYWGGLGEKVLEFIASSSLTELTSIAEGLKQIRTKKAPADLIKLYAPYMDTSVNTEEPDDWYCLLRKAQGKLGALRGGPQTDSEWKYVKDVYTNVVTTYDGPPVRHYENSASFLLDSLFCEYAYIINIDDGVLEMYRGYNQSSSAAGRYAAQQAKDKYNYNIERGYFGVRLAHAIPLAEIIGCGAEYIVQLLAELNAEKDKEDAA